MTDLQLDHQKRKMMRVGVASTRYKEMPEEISIANEIFAEMDREIAMDEAAEKA